MDSEKILTQAQTAVICMVLRSLTAPLAVGAMTREELDAELQKGVDSTKAGKVYSADEVDAVLAKEFGI